MGIAFNSKNMTGIAVNGKKVTGIVYNGNIIYYNGIKIVTFKNGTDKEIAAMLEAHYAGKINIEDYWAVGDTRVVQLTNLGNSGTAEHVDQKMTMSIIGFNHDDLKERIDTRDKAAVTIQCREILGNNGAAENEHYWGSTYKPTETDNYTANPLRVWLNNNFVSAMPSILGSLVKTVNKKNLARHIFTSGSPVITEDKAFLVSYPEVFGETKYSFYSGNTTFEGNQYDYYKVVSNRIKNINADGNPFDSSGCAWWLRSPASYNDPGGYYWILVTNKGAADTSTINKSLAPAFCL